ncbi:MAG: hypothetical protein R3D35_01750 [Nitratireductor sp.]
MEPRFGDSAEQYLLPKLAPQPPARFLLVRSQDAQGLYAHVHSDHHHPDGDPSNRHRLCLHRRHWQTVTQRLSTAVTADLAAIIDVIRSYPEDENYEIARIAEERPAPQHRHPAARSLSPATAKPFFSILDDVLQEEIAKQIGRPGSTRWAIPT